MGIAVERKLKHSRRLAWAFRGKYEVEVIRSAELGKGTGLLTKLVQSWEHNLWFSKTAEVPIVPEQCFVKMSDHGKHDVAVLS